MLATDELELAYPGTGAPALGGGPPLRRILVAVRARRSSRGAGGRGALLPHDWRRAAPGTRAHVRPARAPRGPVLHGDGRHSGRARQGTAGRLGLRRPAVHSRVQHPDQPRPQGGNHARAESHHRGRGGAGAGSGRKNAYQTTARRYSRSGYPRAGRCWHSRRGNCRRPRGLQLRHPRLLQREGSQRLACSGATGRGHELSQRVYGDHLEHHRAGRSPGSARSNRGTRTRRRSRTIRAAGCYRGNRATGTGRTPRSNRTRRTARTRRTTRTVRAARSAGTARTDDHRDSDPDSHANAYGHANTDPHGHIYADTHNDSDTHTDPAGNGTGPARSCDGDGTPRVG